MKNAALVAGLGNPGGEYARTRHNAGFLVVDRLAERWGVRWRQESKFHARLARADRAGRRVTLLQPQTYMNLSGAAVRAVLDFYQWPLDGLLVVVDDADLPLGEIRLRPKGSAGGHHGLESVQQHLGTADYARLRVGIGRQPGNGRKLTGYVLGPFTTGEMALVDKVIGRAADQVECWLAAGIQEAMNKYNGAVDGARLIKETE
jgi:PTH1 family peptidyl-tRNA hydrolase